MIELNIYVEEIEKHMKAKHEIILYGVSIVSTKNDKRKQSNKIYRIFVDCFISGRWAL